MFKLLNLSVEPCLPCTRAVVLSVSPSPCPRVKLRMNKKSAAKIANCYETAKFSCVFLRFSSHHSLSTFRLQLCFCSVGVFAHIYEQGGAVGHVVIVSLCLTASYRRMAVLTETLSESTVPSMGMRMWASAAWRQGWVSPVASVPMTMATGRRMSVS